MTILQCLRVLFRSDLNSGSVFGQVLGLVVMLAFLSPEAGYSGTTNNPDEFGLHPLALELPAQTRKIVLLDDGSTGSRVMAFCFGRNDGNEEFKLIGQSRMYDKASALKPEVGGISDETVNVIGELLENAFCQSLDSEKPEFFLGATAGKRKDKEQAKKIFEKIREKLIKHPVTSKYKINLRVLRGLEEGAYNWLAVNYTHKLLDSPGAALGIIEMGGGSIQLAFQLPELHLQSSLTRQNVSDTAPGSGTNFDVVKIWRRSGNLHYRRIDVYAESWMGFGLKYAYNRYLSQKKTHGFNCDPENQQSGVDYNNCHEAMEQLFEPLGGSPDYFDLFYGLTSQLDRFLPDTFYLSGYFYDYTVAKGLHSHLRINELEAAAEYACTHFTMEYLKDAEEKNNTNLFADFLPLLTGKRPERIITDPGDFQFTSPVPAIKNDKFCAYITYMGTVLRKLGITEQQQLVIVKSLKFEGRPYPATWSPGYAIGWANDWLEEESSSE